MKRPIRDVIKDEDYWERRFAISAAHKSKDVDALIQALADPDHRWKAAEFLGQLGDRRAVRPLTRLLDASDPIVRSFAATALSEIGSPEPVQRLLDIAENDPVLAVRLWAIEAMGIIGDKTVAARLAKLLDDPSHICVLVPPKRWGESGPPRRSMPSGSVDPASDGAFVAATPVHSERWHASSNGPDPSLRELAALGSCRREPDHR